MKSNYIPEYDKNYIPFGIYNNLDPVIEANKFFPVYITGPTGVGKTTAVEQLCSKHSRELIKVNFNNMIDEEQLIGSKTLVDGNVEVIDGPVIIAMKSGKILLLDEIDAAHPNSILCIQSVAEGKPYYYKLKDEWIIPAQGFNIIATANTKGKGDDTGEYIGTNIHNEAFLDRFSITLEQSYPPADIELLIINKLMEYENCSNSKFASDLIKWAKVVRKTYQDGGVSENISTRRLIHIVRAYSIFKNEEKSVELSISRFDKTTKNSFLELYEKISYINK